jgi:Peptidase family C25/Propeptide_C25
MRDRAGVTTLVAAILLLTLAAGGGEAFAAKKPTAKSALTTLVKQTGRLPASAAPAAKRRTLKRLAVHARRSARRRPCASVHDLNVYRRVLGSVKVKKKRGRATRRLLALGPASLDASRRLLASRRTRHCGGGSKARPGDNPKVRVIGSDGRRLRVRVQMPEVGFSPAQGGGKTWTELSLPNSDSPSKPGTPGIPFVSDVLAVPDGAKMALTVNDVDKIAMDGVDVFPAQPDPVDDDTPAPDFDSGPFADAPFRFNRKAYSGNDPIPAKPADTDSLGQFRDLNVGALQLPAVQYNPDKKKLSLIMSIDVTVSFRGGSHTFSDQLGDPWEEWQRKLALTFLNKGALRSRIFEILRRCGEQMMVITNPATLAAANSFASARGAAGIRTRVFQTGTGTGFIGTTPAEIQTAIRNELLPSNFLCIRPSYVTIMGDDDLVPTFPGVNGIPSDLQYSMKDDIDELPDLAVGRIIGNDQTAVQTAVDKIVSYENSPPPGAWLRHATIAAQFQDDDNNGQENRTFIQFAETVRNGLVGHGETVDRIYGEHPGDNPQKFNDGTNLPAALLKPTFAWNGTGADVSGAWNDGRFMMVHRDHGWSDGWGTPGFGTANVQALTNGNILPVMLSINCSSGAYDYDETSFAGESLVKADGGAVGVFGDTRDSPTWHNTQIAWGFADGLLPFILPSEGPATRQRTGNALINGKLRLAGLAPPAGDGNTRNELYLWHYFGDPTMQMWGAADPLVLNPERFTAIFARTVVDPPPGDPPPYWVIVQLPPGLIGETLSILRSGDVVGKATVTGDTVRIPASLANDASGKLQVSLEPDGSPPVTIDVKSQPTSLSQQCPAQPVGAYGNSEPFTVSGHLDPAFAGATIEIRYTTASSSTFERTVTTDANGNWSKTIVANDEAFGEYGTWKVQARFGGDAGHDPSTAAECTVVVFNDG